jgi:hypothetical protein
MNAVALFTPTFQPTTRAAYMSSNLGKARASIANACELSDKVKAALDDLSTAITVGNGTKRARERLADAVLDLRLVAADADAYCRLMESE